MTRFSRMGGSARPLKCRPSAGRLETVTAIEAIVRQDGRRPSNGATLITLIERAGD
jgi:hypothetical protein